MQPSFELRPGPKAALASCAASSGSILPLFAYPCGLDAVPCWPAVSHVGCYLGMLYITLLSHGSLQCLMLTAACAAISLMAVSQLGMSAGLPPPLPPWAWCWACP